MSADARTEAARVVAALICDDHEHGLVATGDGGIEQTAPVPCPECVRFAGRLLDAIGAPVLARLAVERSGLEQVGWSRQFGHGYGVLGVQLFVVDRDPGEHADDVADSTLQPVYLTEEPTDA